MTTTTISLIKNKLSQRFSKKSVVLLSLGIGCFLQVATGFGAPTFVQEKDVRTQSSRSVKATFGAANTSGNLVIAFVVWDNTSSVTLSDSLGNTYTSVSGLTKWHNNRYSTQVFYARNIKGGSNSVTASFSSTVNSFGAIYIHEYSGLDPASPLDLAVAATGYSGALNSGSIATSSAGDLLFAAGVSDNAVSSPSGGFIVRSATNGDLTMDKSAAAAGSYSITAANSGGAWAIQLVAFKLASTTTQVDTTIPTVPVGLVATAASTSQVNLSWNASSDVDVPSSQLRYAVYRNGAKVTTTAAGVTSWSDSSLQAATSYSYAVSAQDPTGNTSAQSVSANATTFSPALPAISAFSGSPSSIAPGQSATLSWTTSGATSLSIDSGVGVVTSTTSKAVNPSVTTTYTLTAANGSSTVSAQTTVTVIAVSDTQAPTVPSNLNPNAAASSQIELTWSASTDNVGVAGYQVYRNSVRIGVTSATNFSDTGLTAGTTYTYTVSSFDAAGNVSAQSAAASEATFALSTGNYTTTFPLGENPIFENGSWVNGKTNGLDWANVQTLGGLACGTESGSNGYDDSAAILTGNWGPNQSVQATVYSTNQTGTVYEEVELRLRSTITAHNNTGYEITFRCVQGGYVQIVRWNGTLGNFTYITNGGNSNYHGIKTGDVVSASINGNLIIAYVNGVEVIRGTDSTFTTGNPGIGFYLQDGSSTLNRDFGFTSFSASDGSASDSQAPTVPTSLSATPVAPSQINLSWTASSDSTGVAGYQIYRNGVSVGVTSATAYSDTGLSGGTTYSYTVAAFDAAGNTSSLSVPASATTAAVDVTPPTTPTNLQTTNVTSTSATFAWSASTDNIALSGYRIFRNGSQVGTSSVANYTDGGLSSATSYLYTVAAIDTSNNVSAQSGSLSITTTTATVSQPPLFVQASRSQISSGTSVSVTLSSPVKAGNTIVAYVIWSNLGSATLGDTQGNTFVSAVSPLTWGSSYRAQVFYATSLSAGTDKITVNFQSAVGSFGVLYLSEYSGIDPSNPVDVTASAAGNSSTMNSGNAVTTSANDLIFGAGVSDNSVRSAGSGFTSRDLSYGNITEDRVATTAGANSATATHSGSAWGMQMVAFRPTN